MGVSLKKSLNESFIEDFMTLNIINFADMVRREGQSFMRCEESFITMKLIWHRYLVSGLGICTHEIPTQTGLIHKSLPGFDI